ncbi:bifunctional metallophosphatase/5'-nucleotidase [Halalkalibacter urbisdiaboli]|uniref:bifunctional metallophosphatase/5'-nucleotidase n=1 Tax=Halalkalibacter urbisdiaboli TaxID=1960589 RepID=UPI000B44FA3F|nr:bifunctional UDP-sugar hydrolase/5'-nucleotidase [Halalkalibacter urbisdiaboli]
MQVAIKPFILLLLLTTIPTQIHADSITQEEVNGVTFIETIISLLDIDLQEPFISNSKQNPYIEAAYRTKILTNGEQINLQRTITREQAYALVIRSLNLSNQYSRSSLLRKVKDHHQISSEYLSELTAAVELGLITTDQSKNFRPKKPLTTKDLAELISTFKEKLTFIPIIHTNDLHGRILHQKANGELGLAKISNIVNHVRSSYSHAFVFDLGDTFHGTNLVNFNKGNVVAESLNTIQYDAMVPGNHDFNYGTRHLLTLRDSLSFPLLGANAIHNGEALFQRYTIMEKAGKTFAVIGILATDTAIKTSPSNIKGITFEDEIDVTKTIVEAVKKDVDHVIVLSHAGLKIDKLIAEKVEGIDIILGGHSHDTIETPLKIKQTFLTQSAEYGKAVGHTNLIFHGEELIGINGFLYRDHPSKMKDPKIERLIDVYKQKVKQSLNEVVATIPITLHGKRELVRTSETNLGKLLADTMRIKADTDIAFTNGGIIRADIKEGEVTRDDVLTALPFDNKLVQLTITGKELMECLEHAVRLYPEQNGGFLHISGFQFSFNPSKQPGDRVSNVVIDGEPLDPQKNYSVATNDFIASGGDGFTMLDVIEKHKSGEALSNILADGLQSHVPIPADTRITVND